MAEKNTKKYSDSTIKLDQTLLKVIGVLKALKAVVYLGLILLVVMGGAMNDIIAQAGDTLKVGGLAPETVIYIVMGVAVAFNVLYSVFSFRTTKEGAKPILMLILPVIAIIYTEMTRTGGGLLSGNFSWAYVIPTIVNFTAWGCAFQIFRQNKDEK